LHRFLSQNEEARGAGVSLTTLMAPPMIGLMEPPMGNKACGKSRKYLKVEPDPGNNPGMKRLTQSSLDFCNGYNVH